MSERADWLEWRKHGLGSSDAAAVAGMSPWRSPFQVWLQKTGQLEDDQESEAMRWGTLLEPVIADEFERRSELRVVSRQLRIEDPTEPWRRATVDGVVVQDGEAWEPLGIYEGKTTSAMRWALDWSQGLPDHYALQVQHQLAVTGLAHAWVTCLIGGQNLRVLEVERDQRAIDLLLRMEREFWARVEGRLPPPAVDGSSLTAAALREAFPSSQAGKVVALDDLSSDLTRLREARAAIKVAEAWASEAQNRLMAALGEAEVGLLEGREVVTWKAHQERRLDLEALREAEPELAERFTRASTVRPFRLKKEAG
jgi:putative phage-type endonuclease